MPDVEWRHPLPKITGILDRRGLLLDAARGRRVLHLGCVDERQTAVRLGTGDLLHEELAKVAADLTGVDLSPDLAMLEEMLPGRYVHGSVEELDELDLPEVDVVLMPELIEHVGNPGLALLALRRYLTRTGATSFITTPNAYSWTHLIRFAAGRAEWVHPDHRVLFSPTTLATALKAAGLTPEQWWAHAWTPRGAKGLVDRALYAWNPWLAPGIVVKVS
jgi:2-polyprenyl-3-methyl-5-hydroxy-6-metoxy-1,4-benzoquinol methylase